MLKLSRKGIGLLNAQYRSVLKKCIFLNLAAVMFAPAALADIVVNPSGDATFINKLSSNMGSLIGGDNSAVAEQVYMDMSNTAQLYSSIIGLPSSSYSSWVMNYGEFYIGYQYNGGDPQELGNIIISNKHNNDAENIYVGGGVVVNSGDATNDAILRVYGTTFSNNSALSNAISSDTISAGGVISNFSNNKTVISNSSFDNNSAMGLVKVQGGAVYNGVVRDASDQIIGQAEISSSNNRFSNNYAGNQTTDSTLLPFISSGGNIVSAPDVKGGAVYNEGIYVSEKDVFTNNEVFGITASGGAIYNASIIVSESVSHKGNMTINNEYGTINFSQNMAKNVTQSTPTKDNKATGGAISNWGVLTSNKGYFSENGAEGYIAQGGAVYSVATGVYNSNNETYTSNYAKGTTAVGGAIFNGMLDIIIGSTTLNYVGDFKLSGITTISENYAQGSGTAYGGGIYNNGLLESVNSMGITLENNRAISDGLAMGGAIENQGEIHLSNVSFSTNMATGAQVFGGAYSVNTNDVSSLESAEFRNNVLTTSSIGYGGALHNNTLNVEHTLTNVSFYNNIARSAESATDPVIVLGGAISNDTELSLDSGGYVSILKIISTDSTNGIKFDSNQVGNYIGTTKHADSKYYGGAVYNAAAGQLTMITNGGKIEFKSNSADCGGAIYNESAGAETTVGSVSLTSRFNINADNGNVLFIKNKAEVAGGAIYNNNASVTNEINAILFAADNNYISFTENTSNIGGAIANATNAHLLLQLGNNGSMTFEANKATANGGAVNNSGKFDIKNVSGMPAGSTSIIAFYNNTAVKGGAIYNTGTVEAEINQDSGISFIGNKATAGVGGAIYNATTGQININLADSASLIFGKVEDDVYNLGTISITGDMPNPTIPAIATLAVNADQTQITLNSTFGGTGTYNISSTQLNIGETGYINFEPKLNLANNVVNLATNSYLNLDKATDTLTNNDFYIADKATLTYRDNAGSVLQRTDLANTIVNTGLIDLGNDGALSDIRINTLNSQGGSILIDVSKNLLKADEITVNNGISGITNIILADSGQLDIGRDERIYFAHTQSTISLDDYAFVSELSNSVYEIGIGEEINSVDNAIRDWYFYRSGTLNPEVIGYIDLPRSAIEQTRSLLFDVSRANRGKCDCHTGFCNTRVCNYRYIGPHVRMWAKPVYHSGNFKSPIDTDFNTYGADAGIDLQTDLSTQFGIFASYRDGKYENDGKGKDDKYFSQYGSELDITSVVGGLYLRKYFGDLYVSGAAYGGMQSADIKADSGVTASTDGLNIGGQVEVGYDIRTGGRSVMTPAVKASYDYIKFDDLTDTSDKKAEFDTINDIELEAGINFEYQFNNERQLPTIGYFRPSIVHALAKGGNVKVNGIEFDETLESDTFGRVELGLDAELVKNFSVGAFGNYSFGSDYSVWSVGGNVRYVW